MKRKILLIPLALLLAISLIATGCPAPVVEPGLYEEYVAGLAEGEFPVPRDCFEQAIEEGKLYLYEWAGWWPEEIYSGFSEEFGIEITRDYFASGGERSAKFSLNPQTPYDLVEAGNDISYDFEAVGATGQINPDWIPNVWEYIPEEYIEMPHDPGWKHSVGYRLWFDVYLINTKYVDDPRMPSWAVLLDPMDELKGKLVLLNEHVSVVGAALKYLGYNYYSVDEAELMEARDLLMELKPHILAFDSWPKAALLADEVWIAHGWSADGWFLHREYEALIPVTPAEGSILGMSTLIHPIGSPNPAAAHLFLNYIFRPEVMALLIETIIGTPLHTAVPELLSEEVLQQTLIPEGFVEKSDVFDPRGKTGRGLELRLEIWEELKR